MHGTYEPAAAAVSMATSAYPVSVQSAESRPKSDGFFGWLPGGGIMNKVIEKTKVIVSLLNSVGWCSMLFHLCLNYLPHLFWKSELSTYGCRNCNYCKHGSLACLLLLLLPILRLFSLLFNWPKSERVGIIGGGFCAWCSCCCAANSVRMLKALVLPVYYGYFHFLPHTSKVLVLALSVTFLFRLFVCEISPEPLNGFVPNSQGRRVWSLRRMSLNVKVKDQGHQGQKCTVHSHHPPPPGSNGMERTCCKWRHSRRWDHSVAAERGDFGACVWFVW